MILDKQHEFSLAQAITADAGSTNILDLQASRALGAGEPMAVLIKVDVAADATTGDETYEVEIQTDGDVAFGSATDLQARVFTAAQLAANTLHVMPLDLQLCERYLRLRYDVGGTTPTVTLSAWLVPMSMIASYRSYADAITIS